MYIDELIKELEALRQKRGNMRVVVINLANDKVKWISCVSDQECVTDDGNYNTDDIGEQVISIAI